MEGILKINIYSFFFTIKLQFNLSLKRRIGFKNPF